MRVMITGSNGFVGQHVIRYLAQQERHQILAVSGPADTEPVGVALNLTQKEEVDAAVQQLRPSTILHMAAQSSVRQSWQDPRGTLNVNTIGSLNIWSSAAAHGVEHFIYVSSAEVYDARDVHELIPEDSPLGPQNPYGLSKMATEGMLQQLAPQTTMRLTILRPFNQVGPGQGDKFVVQNFARQLIHLNDDGQRRLFVGNLDAVRDFLDVRDAAVVYGRVVECSTISGIFNVCSGVPRSVRSVLDDLIRLSNMGRIEVVVDAARLRPVDTPFLVGDPGKLWEKVKWRPQTSWDETITSILAEEIN